MTNLNERHLGLRRFLALILGLLFLGSLLAGLTRNVDAKVPSKGSPPKETTKEKPDKEGPGKLKPAPAGASGFEQVHIINQQIEAQWKENNLAPSRKATDYEFIRRVTLDIVGRIPTPQEIDLFLKEPATSRRAQLINRLLDSEEYARNWADIWSVWLLTRSGQRKYQDEMQVWLEDQFSKENQGWDKIVTGLLTATGKNDANGATNFILAHQGEMTPPDEQSKNGFSTFVPITSRTTRLFLGLQVQCTQCHDHPFNPQWKQKNFWGINGFFRQVKGDRPPTRGRMELSPTLTLTDDPNVNATGETYFEERRGTLLMTKPEFLDGTRMPQETGKPRRQILSELITGSPYFPKAYVNRMWGHFFGRGFTNPGPVDDFGEHNPVTHPLPADSPLAEELKMDYGDNPTLLDYLARQFKNYNYDPKTLIRWICNSEPYQLSAVATKANDKSDAEPFFSRMLLKSMGPEELFESIMKATGAEAGMTVAEKKELQDQWMKNLTVNFGDDEGNEVTFNGTVVQALILMNGEEINKSVTNREKGTVASALKMKTPKLALQHIYLTALGRPATDKEYSAFNREISYVQAGKVKIKDLATIYEDVLWALINSNEFILNH